MNPSEKMPASAGQGHSNASGRRAAEKKRRWLLIGGSVVLLGLLAVGAKLAYPGIKTSRARQHAAEAESALRKGNLELAGTKVKTALAMGPKLPEVLRAAARYCALRGDPAGITYFQMLLATSAGTMADRTNLISLAHATGRIGPARDQLREMLASNSNDAVAMRFLIENHLLALDQEKAVLSAAFALKAHPTNTWFQLTLGSLLIDDPRGDKYQDEGRRLLFSLAIGQSADRLAAQNRIAQAKDLTKPEASVLQKQIQSRTNRTIDDEVIIYDLRRRQAPDKAADIVGEAINRYRREDPGLGLTAVVTWAAKGKQYVPITAALPAAEAATNRLVAPIYAAVLSAKKEWADLEKFVGAAESAIGKTLTAGFRARVAMAQGDRREAERLFRSLGGEKDVSIIDARILAEQAESAGLPGVAVEIYQRLSAEPSIAYDAARQCVRLLGSLEDIAQIREVAGRLAKAFPQEDGVALEAAWANLVANQDIAESWEVMSRLHLKASSNQGARFGLALAELKMDRPQKALALIQESKTPFPSLSPRMQLAQVMTLGANQQRDAAKRLASQIDLSRLRQAERAMVTPWL